MVLCVVCVVNFSLLMMFLLNQFLFDIRMNLSSGISANTAFTVIYVVFVAKFSLLMLFL